jgi:hypothetical protein
MEVLSIQIAGKYAREKYSRLATNFRAMHMVETINCKQIVLTLEMLCERYTHMSQFGRLTRTM